MMCIYYTCISHTHVRFNHVRIHFTRKAFMFMVGYIHHFKHELHQIDSINSRKKKSRANCVRQELSNRKCDTLPKRNFLLEYPTNINSFFFFSSVSSWERKLMMCTKCAHIALVWYLFSVFFYCCCIHIITSWL